MRPISFSSSSYPALHAGFALSCSDRALYVGAGADSRTNVFAAVGSITLSSFVNATGLTANEDFALIAAMARGDERAAAQLYDKYSAPLFALAIRVVGESADAEDVVLDAFTQAWNSAARYETSRGSVLGWLTTIVRSRALDLVRGRGRRAKAVDTASRAMGDEPVAVAGPKASASEMIEENERAHAVTSAMSVLSEQQRVAIELAFFEGLTHSEIADRLDEPLGTVKTRIRLGMQKLRDVLRDLPQVMIS